MGFYSNCRRQFAAISCLVLTIPVVFVHSNLSSQQYAPFSSPLLGQGYSYPENAYEGIYKRGSCPVDYSDCSNVGDSGSCCPDSDNCELDDANQVACCATGASCTGTISNAESTVTGSTFSQTGSSTTTGATITTSASGLYTYTTTVSGNPVTTTVSTIPNALYPFTYIPTSFANAAVCSSYYTGCQSQFASCTSYLEGGSSNQVTISGVTGLITVAGATTTLATSQAISECSTLSESACHNLKLTQCTSYGTDTASFVAATQSGAAAARITGCSHGMKYAMGAGVAVGVAGALA